MAKLTGKKKAEFLARMAKGRRKAAKAARGNPKKKAARTKAKKASNRKSGKLTGKKKAEFLARMAKGRRKAARGTANPKKRAPKKKTAHRPKTRKNNMADAEAMFEKFHQKAPGHVIDFDQTVHYREHFADMGDLRVLRFALDAHNKKFPLTRFKGTMAVTTADGSNIYFVGGDQSVDLEALDIGGDKDMVELGPCNYIEYFTVKGFHDFAPTRYQHEFGEEDGVMPMLTYDRLNERLFLVGGNYRVRREGIVN